MKRGRTIQEMLMELVRQDAAKEDYLVNTNCLRMEVDDGVPKLRLAGREEVQLSPLDIRATAHRQIGAYLDIPVRYYNKMLEEEPELLACNVNRWFQHNPEQRMLRAIAGHARAFLSKRYRRIENLDIARFTLPRLEQLPEARVESCEITDSRMYIKVVNPRLQAEVVPGDVVQAGVIISNSEIGQGAVWVKPLVYRLVCSNGMVVNDAKTGRYHTGRAMDSQEDFSIYSEETKLADDVAFVKKLQDTVDAAVREASFLQVVDKMRESQGVRLDTRQIPEVVRLTGASFHITEEECKGVLQHLIESADLTLYGLANAITRFSQDVESYDRATALEEIGYKVMTMPRALQTKITGPEALPMAA